MGFALCYTNHRDALIADFRQFYSYDLPLLCEGEFEDMPRASILWQCLPKESRCAQIERPELIWTPTEYMLRSIEFGVRFLMWSKSKGAGKRGAKFTDKPIQTPLERIENERKAKRSLEHKCEIAKIFDIDEEVLWQGEQT